MIKGTTIVLYQSTGENIVVIENYIGKDLIETKTSLILKGITVREEKKDVSDVTLYRDKENVIIDQSVEAGTELKEGDEIVLYIPNIYDVYPDFVGEKWSEADIRAFADEYEIVLEIEYKETDTQEPDIVIYQSRSPESRIVKGVTLKVEITKEKASLDPDTENTEGEE